MTDFQTVGRADEVGEGAMRVYEVSETSVGVARIGGSLYAFSDICTHQQCNLLPEDLDGTRIDCECHGSAFDVTTGAVLNGPAAEPISTYQVREEGGDLQVAT
jgi:3-phenylpropionate/trans-cinnamate dioxygenase ferredoxin component